MRTPQAPGDELTQRTFPLFFDVVRALLAGGVTVVAEAAFQDRLWRRGLEPLADMTRLRIIQCHIDPTVGHERRIAELETGGRRSHAELIGTGVEEWEQAYASFERLSLPAPSIDVDTTDGLVPGLDEIVAFANSREAHRAARVGADKTR